MLKPPGFILLAFPKLYIIFSYSYISCICELIAVQGYLSQKNPPGNSSVDRHFNQRLGGAAAPLTTHNALNFKGCDAQPTLNHLLD